MSTNNNLRINEQSKHDGKCLISSFTSWQNIFDLILIHAVNSCIINWEGQDQSLCTLCRSLHLDAQSLSIMLQRMKHRKR